MSDNSFYDFDREAGVRKAVTLHECSSSFGVPIGKKGPLVAKIPVVIAEPEIQIDVESVIELDKPALEIKRIKKDVFLTQCQLVGIDAHKKGKLFISGFVRKNVEYATVNDVCADKKNKAITGDIRHATFNIPFSCVTEVKYVNPPVASKSGFSSELIVQTDKMEGCDPCAGNIIGRNPCEQEFQHYEAFNEKVFCEIEEVKIFEEDIHKNPHSLGCEFPVEHVFDSFVEKMVLFIRLKLLQKQQVHVPEPVEPKKKDSAEYYKVYERCGKWHWKCKKVKK